MSPFPLLTGTILTGLLVRGRPGGRRRPAAAAASTVYGDVIVEVISPKDPHSGVVPRPR